MKKALLVGVVLLLAVSTVMLVLTQPLLTPVLQPGGAREEGKTVALADLSAAAGALVSGYAYPDKLVPEKMLGAALAAMADRVPSMVAGEPQGNSPRTVEVRVRDASRRFEIGGMKDLFSMCWTMMEVAGFLARSGGLDPQDKPEDLEDAAIEGMLSVLDPHTTWLNARDLQELRMSTDGRFGGLGVTISVRKGKLKVMTVMEGTPAAEAGLQPGDLIVQIGEESTVNLTVSEAADRLRGEPGTRIELWYSREGLAQPVKLNLERKVISVKSVEASMLPGGVAFVRVKNFQRNTAREVKDFLSDHQTFTLAGVILDLRGDAGGVMDEAVQLADLFLADGVIVSTRSRVEDPEESRARPGDPWEEGNLVVLVDDGTASASEIVTAALKIGGRAAVLGSRTFGKGSVQYLKELGRGALKMTIAQYLGPGEVSVQGRGIEPQVELVPVYVSKGRPELSVPSLGQFGEETLENHLVAETRSPDPEPPLLRVRYVLDAKSWSEGGWPPPPLEDPEVEIARHLLLSQRGTNLTGPALVERGLPELQALDAGAQWELSRLLGLLGVDWGEAQTQWADVRDLVWTVQPPEGALKAGETAVLRFSVANSGDGTFERLHLVAFSEDDALDGAGCILGRLPPGAEGRCEMELTVPAWAADRQDRLRLDLYDDEEPIHEVATVDLLVEAAPKVRPEVELRLLDLEGRPLTKVPAEGSFKVGCRLWNRGDGALADGLASIKALEDHRYYLVEGRRRNLNLAPGEGVALDFVLRTMPGASGEGDTPFRIWVSDPERRAGFHRDFGIPPPGTEAPGGILLGRYQAPLILLERWDPPEMLGTATGLSVEGTVDYPGQPPRDPVLALWVNGKKRDVLVPKLEGWTGTVPFRFRLDLEPGLNHVVVSAMQKEQSQSFVELVYNRVR
jgi:carboxyl-terminal processing protease